MFFHWFFNMFAHKLSGETWGGQNSCAKLIFWLWGFQQSCFFMFWALHIRFDDHWKMLIISTKVLEGILGHFFNVGKLCFLFVLYVVEKKILKHHHKEFHSQISNSVILEICFRCWMSNFCFETFFRYYLKDLFKKRWNPTMATSTVTVRRKGDPQNVEEINNNIYIYIYIHL